MSKILSFVGAGQMAEALARAICEEGAWPHEDILAADPLAARRELFQRELGLQTTNEERQAISEGSVVLLAVKPQVLPAVLAAHAPLFTPDKLVISIVAGYPIARIAAEIGDDRPIVRVMPNLAARVRAAASAYCANAAVTPEHREIAERLLGTAGIVAPVEEKLLDAVTGASASGLAFVAVLIEALADGGVLAGLPRETALAFAAQTTLGAAKMVLEDEAHPAVLKDQVCSPGGTTIAGVRALEAGGFRSAVMEAVAAATRRAGELGG